MKDRKETAMAFRTYWDLSEKERAALTSEDVERFAAAELMRLGVLQVGPLMKDAEPVIVEPPKRIYFQITVGLEVYSRAAIDILFDDEDDARSFLDSYEARVLKSERLNDDWSQQIKVAVPLQRPEVTTVEAISADDFRDAKTALEKRAAVRAANDKREEEWTKEKAKEEEALKGMWTDWQRCRDLAVTHQRVADTLAGYVATADGDRAVAFRFLRKVFTDPKIAEAATWCGFTAPSPFFIHDGRIEEVHAAREVTAQ